MKKQKHQMIMSKILSDISKDSSLSVQLGFKGGTCAYLFYGLTRFSVDLDFDLFDATEKTNKEVLDKVIKIAQKYGKIKDSYIKFNTIFVLLSYGENNYNIKIEINIRDTDRQYYEMKEYLGFSLSISKKDYMFSMKLVALLDRKRFMMRDVFDIYYFASKDWDIDGDVIKKRTGKDISDYLEDCILKIAKIKSNQLLMGIGQLVDEKQKVWIKESLISETIFLLKNYQNAMKKLSYHQK